MKNILNTECRKKGKKELTAVFKALRFKDGLTEAADISTDDFSYWYNRARDGQLGSYIVFEAIESEPVHRADNAVIAREFCAQIDVFSVRSFETKAVADALSRLETQLTNGGFGVDLREEEYEADTHIYHTVLLVTKTYFTSSRSSNNNISSG